MLTTPDEGRDTARSQHGLYCAANILSCDAQICGTGFIDRDLHFWCARFVININTANAGEVSRLGHDYPCPAIERLIIGTKQDNPQAIAASSMAETAAHATKCLHAGDRVHFAGDLAQYILAPALPLIPRR